MCAWDTAAPEAGAGLLPVPTQMLSGEKITAAGPFGASIELLSAPNQLRQPGWWLCAHPGLA